MIEMAQGPVGGMGQRPNAQGYDLNRDHMKLDAPEARSLVGMMTAYDPWPAGRVQCLPEDVSARY